MYFRILILVGMALVAAAGATSAAQARGTVRVQQRSGAVKTYYHVYFRLAAQTLWLRSADRKGTLEILAGACSFERNIERCLPYAVNLYQNGKARHIAIASGTVYVNNSKQARRLADSSQTLAPNTVLAFFHTQRGTYVTVRGSLDRITQ